MLQLNFVRANRNIYAISENKPYSTVHYQYYFLEKLQAPVKILVAKNYHHAFFHIQT